MKNKNYKYIEKAIINYWSAILKGNQKRANKIIKNFIKKYEK